MILIDSQCCWCGLEIKAQVIPECSTLILFSTSGKVKEFVAMEWCPNCQEMHLLTELPMNFSGRGVLPKVAMDAQNPEGK
jgi:hypothetical protein